MCLEEAPLYESNVSLFFNSIEKKSHLWQCLHNAQLQGAVFPLINNDKVEPEEEVVVMITEDHNVNLLPNSEETALIYKDKYLTAAITNKLILSSIPSRESPNTSEPNSNMEATFLFLHNTWSQDHCPITDRSNLCWSYYFDSTRRSRANDIQRRTQSLHQVQVYTRR